MLNFSFLLVCVWVLVRSKGMRVLKLSAYLQCLRSCIMRFRILSVGNFWWLSPPRESYFRQWQLFCYPCLKDSHPAGKNKLTKNSILYYWVLVSKDCPAETMRFCGPLEKGPEEHLRSPLRCGAGVYGGTSKTAQENECLENQRWIKWHNMCVFSIHL